MTKTSQGKHLPIGKCSRSAESQGSQYYLTEFNKFQVVPSVLGIMNSM